MTTDIRLSVPVSVGPTVEPRAISGDPRNPTGNDTYTYVTNGGTFTIQPTPTRRIAPLLFASAPTPKASSQPTPLSPEVLMADLEDGNRLGVVTIRKTGPLVRRLVDVLAKFRPSTISTHVWTVIVELSAKKWIHLRRIHRDNIDSPEIQNLWEEVGARMADKARTLKEMGVSDTFMRSFFRLYDVDTFRHLYTEYGANLAGSALYESDPIDAAREMREASDAAAGIFRKIHDPHLWGLVSVLRHFVVKAKVRGEKEGKIYAGGLLAAYLTVYRFASTHELKIVRSNARTLASNVIRKGIRGRTAGRRHTEKSIGHIQSARAIVEDHPNPIVRSQSPAILSVALQRSHTTTEATAEYLRRAAAGTEAAYDFFFVHPDNTIHPFAKVVSCAAAVRGILGKDGGRKFAQEVSEAYGAALTYTQNHPDEVVRVRSRTLSYPILQRGIRTADRGLTYVKKKVAELPR